MCIYLFQKSRLCHFHSHHPLLASPGRGQETRPAAWIHSPQATNLNQHNHTVKCSYGVFETDVCYSLYVCLLTCFVFDKNIHRFIQRNSERFVFGVFGLIWCETSVRLCDKRLGHIPASCTVSDFIVGWYDQDTKDKSCVLVWE